MKKKVEKSDVDVSIIKVNLRLSYEERIRRHEMARQLTQLLRAAGKEAYAKSGKPS